MGFLLASAVLPLAMSAATINVSTSSQLSSAVASANPGDLIVMANGNYSGFTMTRSGDSSAAITIQAANVGGAVINSGTVQLNGVSYVNLDGIKFTTSGGSATVDGTSRIFAVLLDNATHCRITRGTFALSGPASGTGWITLGGNSQNNEIDHCEFGPNSAGGHSHYIFPTGSATISGVTPPSDRTSWAHGNGPYNPNIARFTEIDHNYFHDMGSGDGETIVLGGVGVCGDYQGTMSTVEYNLFVNCDGDAEIVSTKSSTNTIRFNTVQSSAGVFSLRSGNASSIYGNFFLCAGSGGGVKINEMHHKVYNNYIENSDTSNYPIMCENGDPYSSSSFAHAQVVDAEIEFNTVVNPGRQVLIGHGSSTLPVTNSVFANNIISGSGTLYSEDSSPAPVNMTRSQNIANGTDPGKSGFIIENPSFTSVNENGFTLQKLSSGSPAIGAANASYYSYVTDDMDGQTRSSPDIGADEYSTASIARTPLTTSNVGPASGGGITGGGGNLNGVFEIQNVASGLVMNSQGLLTNGSPITQWTVTTSSNLDWTFIATSNGYYQINNPKSGKDAVVQGASTANGALIVQWSLGSSGDDQWLPSQNSDGSYTFINLHSGLVLEDPGSSTNKNTQLDQWSSNGGNNQKWMLLQQ
jgi:poly(beta-D-mannuronate) lyase